MRFSPLRMSRSCSNVTPPENVNFSASCSNTPRAALISTGRARVGDFAAVSEGTRGATVISTSLFRSRRFAFCSTTAPIDFPLTFSRRTRPARLFGPHRYFDRTRAFPFRLSVCLSSRCGRFPKRKECWSRDVDGACGGNLIRHVAFRRINLHAHVFEFVMAVGKRGVFRCFDEQIESIVFSDALFVTFDDTGHLFRQLRRF